MKKLNQNNDELNQNDDELNQNDDELDWILNSAEKVFNTIECGFIEYIYHKALLKTRKSKTRKSRIK